ncbi:hypothetical protein KR52_07675 [Synechococcus sp. KORDI-52]|nr:hypothetical protein KR52_07675 [Synechococcus sp. KORDI-52]
MISSVPRLGVIHLLQKPARAISPGLEGKKQGATEQETLLFETAIHQELLKQSSLQFNPVQLQEFLPMRLEIALDDG